MSHPEPTFYEPSHLDQIEQCFVYHPVHGDQPERYGELRATAKDYAQLIDGLCPPSREKSLALTKLQEVVMWANAAIAIHEADTD